MEKKIFLPMATAIFVVAVGLLFLGAVFIELPALKVKSPESFVLAGVALFLVLFGCVYGYLLATGKLSSQRRTITDVRQEAVEKIQDQSLLARMAKEDPDKEVREAAQERLQEVAS
jgi:protein-S-isoprenylcysteine O-methyltransferase Ste14